MVSCILAIFCMGHGRLIAHALMHIHCDTEVNIDTLINVLAIMEPGPSVDAG